MKPKIKQRQAKLTSIWYKKLRDEGFDDIEFFDDSTGYGQNSDYLKRSSARILQKYSAETAAHYQICYQYSKFTRIHNTRDRFCIDLYLEGVPYRKIISMAKAKGKGFFYDHAGKQQLSLFSLHHIIKKFVKKAYEWHKRNDTATPQSLLDQMNDENTLYYGTGSDGPPKRDDDY